MVAERQSVGQWMASIFGKSEKVISEKLTTEEHTQFTAEAGNLQSQISALEQDKATLTTEKTTLASDKSTLEGKVTSLESVKTDLQSKLTLANTERDKYKAWFEKQKGVGAELPEGDATSQTDESGMASYNSAALDYFRKNKAA